ncbi:LysR family transcriptional regulator [Streptomyces sp. P38-E01]|uniref:LysR family transcriptional regulator n=1 Tax=Streptomyces tardus TaxID=2780544 RepID=A0A949JI95_9ACTN|nr:LysR family transcriptional regulator [Streptomyces tardus]MBU7599368.1 LysR family transcriptional regulator [Streptomyces tardus]
MLNSGRLRLLSLLETLGTVRAVAEATHLSPSTVSQQLAVLERETGSTLLERVGRRVRLTTAGLLLARRGRGILDDMAELEAELRAIDEEPVGTVRLGLFQSAVYPLAVPAVRRLAVTHPRLRVELQELEPHESAQALRSQEADVVVTTADYGDLSWQTDLEVTPLGADPVVLVLPRDHSLTSRTSVGLASCAQERWACDRPRSYMAELTLRLCREAGFEPRVVCRFNNYLLQLKHVESDGSVTLLPSLAVTPEHAVVTRALSPPSHRNVSLAVRRTTTQRAAVTAVVAALRDHPDIPALSSPEVGRPGPATTPTSGP